jgi:hypothetical protein
MISFLPIVYNITNISFNKTFVCTPETTYLRLVYDKNLRDIDNNGLLDIPFTAGSQGNPPNTYAYVAFQNSLNNFQCKKVSNSKINAYSISVGDVNNDGKLDIAFAAAVSDSMYVLINNGGQNFIEQRKTPGYGFPNHVAISNNYILYTDEGSGLGNSALFIYNYSTNSYVRYDNYCKEGISIADLNNDGTPDLVCGVSNFSTSARVYFYLNLGNWSLSTAYPITSYGQFHGVRAADLDNDGRVDVVTCRNGGDVYIYKNNGGNPPVFSLLTTVNPGTYLVSCELAIADVDCDNKLDIIWSKGETSINGPSIGWIKNGTWQNYIIENGSYKVYGVSVGDLNNDGKVDIAAGLDTSLYIYYGTCQLTPTGIDENLNIKINNRTVILNLNVGFKYEIYNSVGTLIKKGSSNGSLVYRFEKSGVYILRINLNKENITKIISIGG